MATHVFAVSPQDFQLSLANANFLINLNKNIIISRTRISVLPSFNITIMMDNNKTCRRSRSVTFAPVDEVVEIPHINEMSDAVFKQVYMSREELKDIRKDCKTLVRMMDEGITKGFCQRGLDQHTHAYTEKHQVIRQQIYDAVFAVQVFETKTGKCAQELLANLCQKFSEESTETARIAALSDALDVHHDDVLPGPCSSRKGCLDLLEEEALLHTMDDGEWGLMQ
jgi:hypothetical protein